MPTATATPASATATATHTSPVPAPGTATAAPAKRKEGVRARHRAELRGPGWLALTVPSLPLLSDGSWVRREQHGADDHIGFNLFPWAGWNHQLGSPRPTPPYPHQGLTLRCIPTEAAAGPSLQGVEPPGERGGLAIARLTAAADVPGAFHWHPAGAGQEHSHWQVGTPSTQPSLALLCPEEPLEHCHTQDHHRGGAWV